MKAVNWYRQNIYRQKERQEDEKVNVFPKPFSHWDQIFSWRWCPSLFPLPYFPEPNTSGTHSISESPWWGKREGGDHNARVSNFLVYGSSASTTSAISFPPDKWVDRQSPSDTIIFSFLAKRTPASQQTTCSLRVTYPPSHTGDLRFDLTGSWQKLPLAHRGRDKLSVD